jgi:hypothetical protein
LEKGSASTINQEKYHRSEFDGTSRRVYCLGRRHIRFEVSFVGCVERLCAFAHHRGQYELCVDGNPLKSHPFILMTQPPADSRIRQAHLSRGDVMALATQENRDFRVFLAILQILALVTLEVKG